MGCGRASGRGNGLIGPHPSAQADHPVRFDWMDYPTARRAAVTAAATVTAGSTPPPRQRTRPAAADPGGVRADVQALAVGQGARDDERGEQRRRHQHDDANEPRRQVAPAERDRAGGLDRRGDHGAARDDEPGGPGHPAASSGRRRRPSSAARLAASTGSPAGATGTSASAIAAPASATPRARRLRSSASSSARKNAG